MLSENLKRYRKKCGYTQEEVAEKLHIVRQTLSKWEKGISVPDADFLVKLAQLYEVDINELLGFTDTKERLLKEDIIRELEKLNRQMEVRQSRMKAWCRLVLVFGIVILFCGIGTGVFAIWNYQMVVEDNTYAAETAGMVLESCMLLFRKAIGRIAAGIAVSLAAMFMGKKC